MTTKVIFTCCKRKHPHRWKYGDEEVEFVAKPEQSKRHDKICYCMPDDTIAGTDQTWRERLGTYNRRYEKTGHNPDKLPRAWELYIPAEYQLLAESEYGKKNNAFILSAGWGLVRLDFLLPYYNITFYAQAEDAYRREKTDDYKDFNHLTDNVKRSDTICLIGPRDYWALYYQLTETLRAGRKVIYHYPYKNMDKKQGYEYVPYDAVTRQRGWQYDCLRALLTGELKL